MTDQNKSDLAPVAQPPIAEQWQPIETAPKGRDVLLLRADGGYFIGDWARFEKYNAPTFTHWMPLPDPPEQQ